MAPRAKDTRTTDLGQDEFQALLQAEMRQAIRVTLMAVLEDEVTTLIGAAPYERSPLRHDHRNGAYARDLDTSVGRIADLNVPRTRRGFRTQVFDRYQRRRRELDASIGEMFIQGVSSAGVGTVLQQLNGLTPTPNIVSRVFWHILMAVPSWTQTRR